MNWLRLLVVMVAMVGCPAVSTMLHNDQAASGKAVDVQDLIVDVSTAENAVFTDEDDTDFDGYLPPVASTVTTLVVRDAFFYQSHNHPTYPTSHGIRAPPFLS